MVPELYIDKAQRGWYEATLTAGGVEITTSPTMHESISAAIKDFGETFPSEFSEFLELRYFDVSIGMHTLARMRAEPEQLAQQLVDLAAAVWRDAEERESRARLAAIE